MVHASRAFLHKMVPCDVVCFATHFAEMRRDLAISVLAAKAKEPPFVKSLLQSWRELPANYTGADLTRWIQRGIAASAEAANDPAQAAEMAQLVAKNAGRSHLGSRAIGFELGIICKKTKGSLRLSDKGCQYEFAETSASLDEFVRVCQNFQSALSERTNFADMMKTAAEALAKAGDACTDLLIAAPGSAVRKAILRKFALGYLADGGIARWSEINIEELRALAPDESEHMKDLPQEECASAVSMLILGRPDCGMLLSMWSCLFAGACASGNEDSMARALEEKGDAAVEAWLLSHAGTGPRPADLCGQLAKRRRS